MCTVRLTSVGDTPIQRNYLNFYWGDVLIFFAIRTRQCIYFAIEARKGFIAWVEVEE
jgi:hypothetical protein